MSLTFVPTPLGNLRDITLRALDVLRDCDLLVAEDTRVARKLLAALALPNKTTWSYREQNAAGATHNILERARSERVAVVCDAGMPGISDPGRELVAAARSASIPVEVLPGASAFVCAAVLSGFDIRRFTFEGFVPRGAAERESALRDALASERVTTWYESPNRVVQTLSALAGIEPDARVFVARELTKHFEQQIAGSPQEVLAGLVVPVRGEIALVIAPYDAAREPATASEIDAAIDAELAAGLPLAAVAKKLSAVGMGPRATLYRRAVERKTAGNAGVS